MVAGLSLAGFFLSCGPICAVDKPGRVIEQRTPAAQAGVTLIQEAPLTRVRFAKGLEGGSFGGYAVASPYYYSVR